MFFFCFLTISFDEQFSIIRILCQKSFGPSHGLTKPILNASHNWNQAHLLLNPQIRNQKQKETRVRV